MTKFKDIWNRQNDGNSKEERSFVRYAIFSGIVFLVIVGFTSQDSLFRYIKTKHDIHRQNKQIELYQTQINDMEQTIKGLKDNLDSLEQYAREEFGFCEPGDEVFIDNK